MKKVLAILLICVYTFGATEACQILKIPILIEHFNQHKSEHPSMSFIDFLVIHYNGKDVIDFDYEDDQRLPFKSFENCISFTAFAVPPVYHLHSKPKIYVKVSYPAFKKQFHSSLFTKGIFQPPKLA